MNVEHIPAEDVDMLPCGADWQSRHLESEKRKAEIRDRIHKQAEQGQKTAKDYFRPAKPTPSIYDSDLKRVAVYARVSTSSEEQISSIENQTLYYTKKIAETENWNLQDIYSDEGKSGTSLRKRDAFKRMMRDAKDQKMDLIICASISRFARNFSDCMTQIAALKTMHPAHPIGVYFETENIYTLNPSSQYSLDIQALLADWESGNKSRRMILSYEPSGTYSPKKLTQKSLVFTKVEGQISGALVGQDDLSNKIHDLVFELYKLDLQVHRHAIAYLFRALLESATKYLSRRQTKVQFNEKALETSVVSALNYFGDQCKTNKQLHSKTIRTWRDTVTQRKLIDTLNQYIHNEQPVDALLLQETWNTMKGCIITCLTVT